MELLLFDPPPASAAAAEELLAGAVEVAERVRERLRRDFGSRGVVSPSAFLLLALAALVCVVGLAKALRLEGGAAGAAAVARDEERWGVAGAAGGSFDATLSTSCSWSAANELLVDMLGAAARDCAAAMAGAEEDAAAGAGAAAALVALAVGAGALLSSISIAAAPSACCCPEDGGATGGATAGRCCCC